MNPVLTRPFGLAVGSLDLIPKEADYAFHPERFLIPSPPFPLVRKHLL